ncbi:MAG: potassium transporter KefB [Bacteroidota bacterium]
MSNNNPLTTTPIHRASLTKRMIQGGLIALLLISIFLLGARNPNPAWPKFWQIKPLLIVPLAGAMGGVFYYFMDHLRYHNDWRKPLAYIVSFIGYFIALWLGTVLGLNGTMWN